MGHLMRKSYLIIGAKVVSQLTLLKIDKLAEMGLLRRKTLLDEKAELGGFEEQGTSDGKRSFWGFWSRS
jgi:hypothetical protein